LDPEALAAPAPALGTAASGSHNSQASIQGPRDPTDARVVRRARDLSLIDPHVNPLTR
jgi:hypothetical protein